MQNFTLKTGFFEFIPLFGSDSVSKINPITRFYLTLLEWFSTGLVFFAELLEAIFSNRSSTKVVCPHYVYRTDDDNRTDDPPYPESPEFPDSPFHHQGAEINSFGGTFEPYDFYDPYDPCNPCKPCNPHFYGDPLDITSPYYFFYRDQQQNFSFDPTSPDYYSHTGIDIGRSDPFDSNSGF